MAADFAKQKFILSRCIDAVATYYVTFYIKNNNKGLHENQRGQIPRDIARVCIYIFLYHIQIIYAWRMRYYVFRYLHYKCCCVGYWMVIKMC